MYLHSHLWYSSNHHMDQRQDMDDWQHPIYSQYQDYWKCHHLKPEHFANLNHGNRSVLEIRVYLLNLLYHQKLSMNFVLDWLEMKNIEISVHHKNNRKIILKVQEWWEHFTTEQKLNWTIFIPMGNRALIAEKNRVVVMKIANMVCFFSNDEWVEWSIYTYTSFITESW